MNDINGYLYKNFMTYEAMYRNTIKAFYGKSDSSYVNVLIDMRSFVRSVLNPAVKFSYKDPQTPVASAVLNLAAHIRHYFRSRHMVESKIYIVWSTNTKELSGNITDYNAHEHMVMETSKQKYSVDCAVEILEELCKYIPSVYFINGENVETAVLMYALLANPKKANLYNAPNIIYTKDPFLYQLVSKFSYTFCYFVKKVGGVDANGNQITLDVSQVIEKKTLYKDFVRDNGYKYNFILDAIEKRTDLFSTIIGISGAKARHLKGQKSFMSSVRLMVRIMDLIPIGSPARLTYDTIFDLLMKGVIRNTKFDPNRAMRDYTILDCESQYKYFMTVYPKASSIFKGVLDLYSGEDLKTINDKYFINYPVNVMNL